MRRVIARLLEFKWRILAVSTALVVVSSIATFGYLSSKEVPISQSDDQWQLSNDGPHALPPGLGKAYRIEIQSIDESAGTARLKADLVVPNTSELIRGYMQLSGLTTFNAKTSPSPPLSFRPLTVLSLTDQMLLIPTMKAAYGTDPFAKFSDSRPQTVETVVEISGDPWWYPFDRYFLAAGLNCDVVLTDANQQSHKLEDQGYYLSTQVPPNLIIKSPTKEDFNRAVKSAFEPPAAPVQSFDPDLWRRGLVVLILHRPIFPRFFAVFFGIVAVIWIWVIGMIADKKQLTLNVVGYFLSIWAIRAPLAIGAPKVTTLMDYVTLGLYAILIAVAAFRLLWGYQKSSTS